MKKKIQLAVPEPCHEGWENMTPKEKGRFCDSCQKVVIDFTNMSDAQLASFFKKPSTGSVCGRFMQDQLERDISIPRKRIPWVKYFFQVALPAMLVTNKATAQGKVKANCNTVSVTSTNPEATTGLVAMAPVEQASTHSYLIKGKVTDPSGRGVQWATVIAKGTKQGTTSDSLGNFQLHVTQHEQLLILATAYVGFSLQETTVQLDSSRSSYFVSITLQPEVRRLEGEVVVVAGGVSINRKKSKSVPLIPAIMDTLSRYFRVYPNPVPSGSHLNIELKKKMKEGYYLLALSGLQGNTVYRKEIWIDEEAGVMNLEMPVVSPGQYFLSLTNKESGKGYTEKLLVQ